jgi:hypothetical protein
MGQGLGATGSTAFRYHAGSLDLNMTPRFRATSQSLDGERPEYGFDSGVTQKLSDAWNLSLASNYTRHASDSAVIGRNGVEGLTVSYNFPSGQMQFDYEYCWSSDAADLGTVSQGPSIGTTFSPVEALNIGVKYGYGVTADDPPTRIGAGWGDGGAHHLDLSADWDFASQGIPGTKMSARYSIEREAAASDTAMQQSASVNLILGF